jgi:hypothetical protein
LGTVYPLSENEFESLRSQFVTSNRGGRKYLPYVFTEQGVSMLSAVLRSPTAIDMSVKIIRAFVNMRKFISENAQIFNAIENKEIKQNQGILLGEGFGATPPTPALFRHAEGVEIVGKNRVIAGFRLWRVTFFNSKKGNRKRRCLLYIHNIF